MKFDELDSRMRVFETAHDHCVLSGIYIVVRLDGRSFTRLTKEVQNFEAPFDVRFRDAMAETVEHLMDCGVRITYGYTESDEISLLLDRDADAFGRKVRKMVPHQNLWVKTVSAFEADLSSGSTEGCRPSAFPLASAVVG
ncbi:tRNAHis guanylyltransferase [Pirellulimonas nuda]|uniref:tRNAHis guanylyltransferase n=1 Tax=Pirellulimonas nuda TaxID=2528009 RepID=A0A518DBY0_9BACT|nr:tRNA(His) guanylyltransferase Thg1 family protein [Pirellulimonas nuda]QDU88992.1 tRNAHis guanylyltransferase [Pirellulimonas nuda]